MIEESDGCSKCPKDEEEIEISQSRLDHIRVEVNLGKVIFLKNPIEPDIPLQKMVRPNKTEKSCVNPACSEWQGEVRDILENINEDLEQVTQTSDWTRIDKERIEYLSQLSEGAVEMVEEDGIEWKDIESQIEWQKIEDEIDAFEENFEPAAKHTMVLHNLRGFQNPDPRFDKLSETADALEHLTELQTNINPELGADGAQPTNEEEEEQGPIEQREIEFEESKAEKGERIEAREAEIEELNAEIDEIEEKISELKTEKTERVEWRQNEIDALGEGDEEQIKTLREEIRNARRWSEKQINKQREQIDDRRAQIGDRWERIEETREAYEDQIDTYRTERSALYEQDEEETLEAEEAASTDRDRAEEKDAAGVVPTDGGDGPTPSAGAATVDQTGEASRSESIPKTGREADAARASSTPERPQSDRTTKTETSKVSDNLDPKDKWPRNPDAERPDPIPEKYEQIHGEPMPKSLRNGSLTENKRNSRENDPEKLKDDIEPSR